VGDYFLNSLFSDIDSLALYAGIHVKIFGYHRMLSTKFPYAIYYDFKDSEIIIINFRMITCLRSAKERLRICGRNFRPQNLQRQEPYQKPSLKNGFCPIFRRKWVKYAM
jgi:hypothetical protein